MIEKISLPTISGLMLPQSIKIVRLFVECNNWAEVKAKAVETNVMQIDKLASSDISAALSSFEDERKPAWCRFVKITDFAFFLVSFPILSMLSSSFAFLERNSFQSLKERVFSYERNF